MMVAGRARASPCGPSRRRRSAAPSASVPPRGEDHLGGLGGELAAGIRGAGLHDDRPALDRPRDVERAAHREILALVVRARAASLGIEIDAALDIADEGVVGPAVPQPGHDVEELARAAVALAVLDMCSSRPKFSAASGLEVVTRFQPARPPLIWSSEAKRRAIVIGLARRWSRRWRSARDARSTHRQRRQQGQRVERGHRGAALQRLASAC